MERLAPHKVAAKARNARCLLNVGYEGLLPLRKWKAMSMVISLGPSPLRLA